MGRLGGRIRRGNQREIKENKGEEETADIGVCGDRGGKRERRRGINKEETLSQDPS